MPRSRAPSSQDEEDTDAEHGDSKEINIQAALAALMRKTSVLVEEHGILWGRHFLEPYHVVLNNHKYVNKDTLKRRFLQALQRGSGEKQTPGPKFTLTAIEEKKLVDWISFQQQRYHTPSEHEVRGKVRGSQVEGCEGAQVAYTLGHEYFGRARSRLLARNRLAEKFSRKPSRARCTRISN
jgi:hypothetical protein